MKRCMAFCLAIVLAFSLCVQALAVDNPAFSVKIEGTLDASKNYNGKNTFVVDWQIIANKSGLNLRGAQGLQLTYDNAVLQLMRWDGSDVIADASVDTSFKLIGQAVGAGVYRAGISLYIARNDSGRIGFLSLALGDPYETYSCPPGTYVSLEKVRFAFREGKSVTDLTSSSIRLMTVAEMSATAQSYAVLLGTDENGGTLYKYRIQANGVLLDGDTLNAPGVTYPGSDDKDNKNDDATGMTPNPSGESPGTSNPSTDSPSGSIFINPYLDIKETAWYYPAVKHATENGLMNGTGSNHFSPDISMTRAMFATILYRMGGQPEVDHENPFVDVPKGEWYSKAISWAHEKQLIMGYGSNRFGLNENVTREQVVTILYRYAKIQGLDVSGQASLSEYTDTSKISSWAQPAMKWAIHHGVMSGRSTTILAPLNDMTRAEVAQILLNFDDAY